MSKIKLTKNELKLQRDALKQFLRFLPTLQLKKQQLQLEMRHCRERIHANLRNEKEVKNALQSWISLFGGGGSAEKILSLLKVKKVESEIRNIAGVDIPVFTGIQFEIEPYDLFTEDLWIDDAIKVIQKLVGLRSERRIIEEQYLRIAKELRVTTQRVNLFEKIKIPECRENIRVIQIYLGDQSTTAVGRAKIAKNKMREEAAA